MISISNSIVKNNINLFVKEIDSFINAGITEIEKLINAPVTPLYGDELTYANKLKNDFKSIVIATPRELDTLKFEFDAIINSKTIKSKYKETFRNQLIEAMGYKKLRSSFFPKYFQKIGIKACVYCNSQLTLSINNIEKLKTKTKINVIAKFQVDHYYAKSEYPCFSISLFNLYPSCASCNNSKSTKSINFKLYTDDVLKTKKSEFKFELEIASPAKYLLSRNIDDIKFTFNEPDKPLNQDEIKGSFQNTFDIEGIYETQKDIAEELILKSVIYNEHYRKKLVNSFPEIFKNVSISQRLIIGNYSEEHEIHKRPMAKFMQDIAKQLNLIE